MKMKLLVFCIFLLSLFPVFATGLNGDVMQMDGKEWNLLGRPIKSDPLLEANFLAFLPEMRSSSTANWEGYTAHWELYEGELYLRRVEVEIPERLEADIAYHTVFMDGLEEHFAAYKTPKGIHASWFSGKIRLGRGQQVRYMHSAYERNLEEEYILTLFEGRVVESRFYQNYKQEGTSITGNGPAKIYNRFPWDKFPELKRQQVVLVADDFQITNDGYFIDCVLHLNCEGKEIEDQNAPVVKAFKDVFKQISPWTFCYVYEVYYPERRQFVIPLRYNKKQSESF